MSAFVSFCRVVVGPFWGRGQGGTPRFGSARLAQDAEERGRLIAFGNNEKAAQTIARPGPVPLVSGGNVWRSSQGGPMSSMRISLLRFGIRSGE
jgi:hypothetical protein